MFWIEVMNEKGDWVEHLTFDIVIIGSGAAGLRAAIAARKSGLTICVISKGSPGMGSSTIMSAGAFSGDVGGRTTSEYRDLTLRSGKGINNPDLVGALLRDASARLTEFMEWGVKAKMGEGLLVIDGPAWPPGKEIIRCLLEKARSVDVNFMSGLTAANILSKDGTAGILAWSSVRKAWVALTARAVVLATGGGSALFLRHDNPRMMMGDGYALAFEAGATLQDMEFVQFYPLILAEPGLPLLLIPPTLLELGSLINSRGQEIREKYGILEKPAAIRARDTLSRALFLEIQREGQEVHLDLTNVDRATLLEEPFLVSTWGKLGGDAKGLTRPLSVAPAAHHVMGGVCVDSHGNSSIPGFFAAGEATGGVHGANRMGGNALTDTIVFGARAGEAAAEWAIAQAGRKIPSMDRELQTRLPDFSLKTETKSDTTPHDLKIRLQHVMWEDGGIIRNKEGIERALVEVQKIGTESERLIPAGGRRSVQDIIELRLGVRTALLILEGALRREESRGAHFREDFPRQRDDAWLGSLKVRRSQKGGELWSFDALEGSAA